jgi:hypothetical protein
MSTVVEKNCAGGEEVEELDRLVLRFPVAAGEPAGVVEVQPLGEPVGLGLVRGLLNLLSPSAGSDRYRRRTAVRTARKAR